MNNFFRKYRSIIIIGILSLLSTGVLFQSGIIKLSQLELQTKRVYHDNQILFFDSLGLHNDPQLFHLYSNSEKNITTVYISDMNNIAFEEFPFTKFLISQRSIISYDMDDDGKKEIFIGYKRNDSLFVKVTSSANWENYFPHDLFILSKPSKIYHATWDSFIELIGVSKEANSTYLYLKVGAGYAQVPRGIYKYNLNNLAIEKKFEMGAFPVHTIFKDFNGDGLKEILVNPAVSMNNANRNPLPLYDDMVAWTIMLDSNLDTIFTKKKTGLGYGGPFSVPMNDGNSTDIITTYLSATEGVPSTLIRYDAFGNELCDYAFNEKLVNYQMLGSYKKNILGLSRENLIVLSGDLKKVRTIPLPYEADGIYLIDINNDGEDEIVLAGKGIMIYDSSFNLLLNHSLPHSGGYISYARSGNESHLMVWNGEDNYYLKIDKSYSTYQIAGVYFLVFLGMFGLTFISKIITIRLMIFFNSLKYATTHSPHALCIINSKMKLLFANHKFQETFSADSKFGKSDLIANKECVEIIDKIKAAEKLNERILLEQQLIINNELIQLNILVIPIILFRKIILGFFIQMENLSNIIKAERSKVLSHSIQKVAHEIKTPLSSVLLSLDSIENNLKSTNTVTESDNDIEIARNEIERVRVFINNYLKYADMSELNFGSADLYEIVIAAVSKFESFVSRGIRISVNINEGEFIIADRYQLTEVFQVLIENAIDAMRGEGNIKISSAASDDKVKISVEDEGTGIQESQILDIFKPYMTTKKDGTGMGLAIAEKILKDHGSRLELNSQYGIGTTFWFYLNKADDR